MQKRIAYPIPESLRSYKKLTGQLEKISRVLNVKLKRKHDDIEIEFQNNSHITNVEKLFQVLEASFNQLIYEDKLTKNQIISFMNGKQSTGQIKIKPFKAANDEQQAYIDTMNESIITFCIGSPGVGKTHCVIHQAIKDFTEKKIQKIVITRPVVESGEKLGFLPGGFEEKLLPYLRPIYDSFEELIGEKKLNELLESKKIEIVPLAYMRGRTFKNSFIILDEAQNCSDMQLKMFLTRIGYGSKMVIDGDIKQSDIGNRSGLGRVISKLQGAFDSDASMINLFTFSDKYTVRHPIIATLLEYIEEDGN